MGATLLLGAGYGLYRGILTGAATWHTTLAWEDLAEGDRTGAMARLQSAVAWDPDHARANLLLAYAEWGSGQIKAARARLEESLDHGPIDLAVLDALARIHEESGDVDHARARFRQAMEQFPEHLAGPLGLARLGDHLELRSRLGTEQKRSESIRGVSLFHLDDGFGCHGYGTPAAIESLRRARSSGANLVSLRVPARQPDVHTPSLVFGHEPAGGETDRAIERAITDAHLLGLRVLLKPHVMLGKLSNDDWRGTINFDDPADLDAWWIDYRRFILHVAEFASAHEVEFLAVGVELRTLARNYPDRWRELIAAVRAVYSGHLTYAANWFHEFAEVSFWDALDSIGVQFFFPVETTSTDVDAIVSGLTPPTRDLAELSYFLSRPVLLTEVGYRSTANALAEPWRWPDANETPDQRRQAAAYCAVLTIFDEQPWCAGLIWWNWLTDPEPEAKFDVDFTPQGKEAEAVIREWWNR